MHIYIYIYIQIQTESQNLADFFPFKGLGESGLFLGCSVFFAIHDAVNAARRERGLFGPLKLNSPLTPEKIRMACEDKFTKMVWSAQKILTFCSRSFESSFINPPWWLSMEEKVAGILRALGPGKSPQTLRRQVFLGLVLPSLRRGSPPLDLQTEVDCSSVSFMFLLSSVPFPGHIGQERELRNSSLNLRHPGQEYGPRHQSVPL